METDKDSIVSYIWHEPHTEFYWIGRQSGHASELIDVAGVCHLLIEWRDSLETVCDLQRLLLYWVLLTLMPDGFGTAKNAIYQDISASACFIQLLHECICVDELRVLFYNEYIKKVKGTEN